ncbi:MAG: hypothetical protein QF473_36140, partial [Planctomycetota bacterium]|nr:hypothetical protein [Planctomycetota bacterium]
MDGKLEVSAKGRIPFLRPGLSLGTLRGGKRQYGFIGSLDDFRVYKGALSAAEVKALFEKDGAPEAAQARRLMTHLPLDSDNKDATANGHHGQPKGIRPVEDRFGVNNRARHFDGDDLIAQQTLPSTARFTYTVWANFASDALKQGWKLVIHKNAGTRRDFILGIHRNAPDMPLTWSIAVQWGKDKRKDLIELHSRNEVMPWRWYHLAFSYADGNYQFFIDGKLDGSAKGKMPAFEPGMTLGGLKTGNSQYGFIGSLDDFRAYNHVLSPTEIEALYREGGFRVIPNAEARPGKLKKSGDHSYHVFRMPGGISWEAARDACTRMGGHLACIETKEENDF